VSQPSDEQSARDIVLIGGSAGAIEALRHLLKELPASFPAAVFAVVHTSADGPGLLPVVLARSANLKAEHPADGDPIRPGHIYVAPPGHHLTLGADDTIRVRRGARINCSRPAIDPLFRTAAAEGYGPRSIAVVLSGYLDDGSAGLYAVRKRGGVAIVQDAADALASDMPLRALQYAGADYILPAAEIGKQLVELVGPPSKVVSMKKRERTRKPKEAEVSPNAFVAYPDEGEGTPSVFACPECHGVLWEIKEGDSIRYRCRTGHDYSETTLNEELSHATENALWAAMRALEEKAAMSRRIAEGATGPAHWKERLREHELTFAKHAEIIRKMIFGEPAIGEAAVINETERDKVG
jgi:two-component system, chemotaxis family, protein-glutamate methylesterase/glutaminase